MTKELTIGELFKIVRKGMTWRGSSLKDNTGKLDTIEKWLEEEDLTNGIFPVKSAAVLDTYNNWCKERQVPTKTIVGRKTFYEHIGSQFKEVHYSGARHYYLNKELKEDPDAKAKRQENFKKGPGKNRKK